MTYNNTGVNVPRRTAISNQAERKAPPHKRICSRCATACRAPSPPGMDVLRSCAVISSARFPEFRRAAPIDLQSAAADVNANSLRNKLLSRIRRIPQVPTRAFSNRQQIRVQYRRRADPRAICPLTERDVTNSPRSSISRAAGRFGPDYYLIRTTGVSYSIVPARPRKFQKTIPERPWKTYRLPAGTTADAAR